MGKEIRDESDGKRGGHQEVEKIRCGRVTLAKSPDMNRL